MRRTTQFCTAQESAVGMDFGGSYSTIGLSFIINWRAGQSRLSVLVITPPAKAGSFLRRRPLQQRLLRRRMTRSSTLASEGSIQAHLPSLQRFKSYVRDCPAQPGNLKLVKCETRVGPEAIILLTPTGVILSVPQRGGRRNAAVA